MLPADLDTQRIRLIRADREGAIRFNGRRTAISVAASGKGFGCQRGARRSARCREPASESPWRDRDESDAHLAGLREDSVSYIFAGAVKLDLALGLDILNHELGIKVLLLEGGGKSNGSFLRAGLIDEISLALCPAIDGARGGPHLFAVRRKAAALGRPGAIASSPVFPVHCRLALPAVPRGIC